MNVVTAILLLSTTLVDGPQRTQLYVDPVRAHQRFLSYSSQAPEARIETLWLAKSFVETYSNSVARHPAYAPCIQLQREVMARLEKADYDSMSEQQEEELRDFMSKSLPETRRLDEAAREPLGKISKAMCGALQIAFVSPDIRERRIAEKAIGKILRICYEPGDSTCYGCIVPPAVNQIRDAVVSDFARSIGRRRPEWFVLAAQQYPDFHYISLCVLAENRHPSAGPLFEKALTFKDTFDLDYAVQAASLWPRRDWLGKLMDLAQNVERTEKVSGFQLGSVLIHARRDGAKALLGSVRRIPTSLLEQIGEELGELPYPETLKVLDLMSKSKSQSLRDTSLNAIAELFNPTREPDQFWSPDKLSRQDWEVATQITRRLLNDEDEDNRLRAVATLETLHRFGVFREFIR